MKPFAAVVVEDTVFDSVDTDLLNTVIGSGVAVTGSGMLSAPPDTAVVFTYGGTAPTVVSHAQ